MVISDQIFEYQLPHTRFDQTQISDHKLDILVWKAIHY